MSNKVILIKNSDGSVHIVRPTSEMFNSESRTRKLLETTGITFNSEEDVWNFIINKDVPKNATYELIDSTAIPTDRTFRNAWVHDNKSVKVHMDKAKEIHKDRLRFLRKPKLEALDVELMQALEVTNNKPLLTDIKNRKQALRDVTTLELPNNPEDLKSFIPDILK